MPGKKPPVAPRTTRHAQPTSRRRSSGRSWLLAGPVVGLIGGTLVGFVEPIVRMWGDADFMTSWLWLEAFSFSCVSHVAAWTTVCTVFCLLSGLLARREAWWRKRAAPGGVACAALFVSLGVAIVLGEAAVAGKFILSDRTNLAAVIVFGVIAVLLLSLLLSRVGRALPRRGLGSVLRAAAGLGALLVLTSIVFQGSTRSRLRSADGFWPPAEAGPASGTTSSPPSVVLVVFDTLRVDRLGAYGYSRPVSPHIDAFAADALRFQQAISPAPWTVPAQASMFTGLPSSQHGASMSAHGSWLEDSFVTLAEALRDRGYQTMALSNNPYVSPHTNLAQGFDRFAAPYRLSWSRACCFRNFLRGACAEGASPGAVFGRWLLEDAGGRATTALVTRWLSERDRSRPLFLFINYMEPHLPYEPAGAYRKAFVKPEDLGDSYRLDQSYPQVHEHILMGGQTYSARDIAILSDLYDARVRELDDRFAELMGLLSAALDLDETIVILTSDHGENLGEHALLGHQYCVYDTLLHVPLIVRWPGAVKPGKVDRRVQTSDIFPTVLRWVGAGRTTSSEIPGRCLVVGGVPATKPADELAVAEYLCPPSWPIRLVQQRHPSVDVSRWLTRLHAVYHGRWKLIVGSDRRTELYDRLADPGERQDLTLKHHRKVVRLERKLATWIRSFKRFDPNRSGRPPRRRIDADRARRLRELGYVQ